jgi:hypothetical protein
LRSYFRSLPFFSAFVFGSAIPLLAQDMGIRVEAVRLMERAPFSKRKKRLKSSNLVSRELAKQPR